MTRRIIIWAFLAATLFLPTGRVQQLLCALLLLGLLVTSVKLVRFFLRHVGYASRERSTRLAGEAAVVGAALYMAFEGLAAWLGMATPGKLLFTLLLAAVVTRYVQIDFGYLWITDPNLPLGAVDVTHPPLWHP